MFIGREKHTHTQTHFTAETLPKQLVAKVCLLPFFYSQEERVELFKKKKTTKTATNIILVQGRGRTSRGSDVEWRLGGGRREADEEEWVELPAL